MADYIKKIRTIYGDKQIDYNSLANLPELITEDKIDKKIQTNMHSLVSEKYIPTYDNVGTYVNQNGGTSSLSGFSMSNPIKIPSGVSQIRVNGLPKQDYVSAIAFYKSNSITTSNLVGKYVCTQNITKDTYIDVPDGALYVVMSKEDKLSAYNTAEYCFIADIYRLSTEVTSGLSKKSR